MAIDKKELQSRLWTEWTNGLKITADSLAKDQIDIINSVCTCVLGEANALLAEKIEYKSTLSDIIIDGDTDLSNEAWGDHAIDAYEKLGNYVNAIMDVLDKAQKELENRVGV